jgi:hypothetical protein
MTSAVNTTQERIETYILHLQKKRGPKKKRKFDLENGRKCRDSCTNRQAPDRCDIGGGPVPPSTFEKVGPYHQQVQTRVRVSDHEKIVGMSSFLKLYRFSSVS